MDELKKIGSLLDGYKSSVESSLLTKAIVEYDAAIKKIDKGYLE
jgi:hypothetical protein